MVLCVASLSSCRFFAKGGAKLAGKVANDMVNDAVKDAAQMYDIDEEIVEEYNDFASNIVRLWNRAVDSDGADEKATDELDDIVSQFLYWYGSLDDDERETLDKYWIDGTQLERVMSYMYGAEDGYRF